MIDGKINLGNNVTIAPQTGEAVITASSVAFQEHIINGPYHSYRLPPSAFLEEKFIPILYFKHGTITELQLHPFNEENDTWSSFSSNDEKNTLHHLESLLTNKLGPPPYNFKWGEVSVVCDEKAGITFIQIRYL